MSEEKLLQKVNELEEELRRLRSSDEGSITHDEIYESLQDIYFRCDLSGKITMLNPSVMELTGYDPKEIIDRNITNYYLYNPRIKDLIKRLVRDKQVRNFEASIVKNNGDILQCLCNIRIIINPEGNREIEGVVRDITEIKKINSELLYAKEVAERSLKVKEKFLANMSHEIRTPLNGIIGMIDLLAGTQLDKDQDNYIQMIKKSSEILLYILNDILEISKIEAGKVKLRKKVVDFRKVIRKVEDLFSQEAVQKGIDFRINIDADIPPYLVLDETRFLQVLSNLTSNALKFTKQGGAIDLLLKLQEKSDKDCLLRIEVKDTGIGISAELQDSLFESFNQLDNSLTKQYSGTGLGLAISQELCRLMGSEISVDSEPEKGSTFWFVLNADISDKAPEDEADQDLQLEHTVFESNPHILLVDDNKINRDVAREILKQSGCQITEADNGRTSIELAESNPYDLIIMDIQMPDMDGIEAMNRIRDLGKETPPIIAMTAYAMKEDEERFLKEGFDGYIAKPIRANSLVQKISRWLTSNEELIQEENTESDQEEPAFINLSIVESLRKIGGDELVNDTYAEFEEESSELIDRINNSLTNSDYNSILSPLHTLKGNSGTLGLDQLYSLSLTIETELKKGYYDNLAEDLRLLNEAFKEFKEKYTRILK